MESGTPQRMWLGKGQSARAAMALTAVLAVLAAFLVAAAPHAQAAIVAPFTSKYSVNAAGAIRLVGNTLLTCSTAAGATNASSCVAGRNGTGKLNNNDFTMVNVDVDADPTTFNSSTANFALPSGAGVLYARLFWGARSTNSSRSSMQLKVPGAGLSERHGESRRRLSRHRQTQLLRVSGRDRDCAQRWRWYLCRCQCAGRHRSFRPRCRVVIDHRLRRPQRTRPRHVGVRGLRERC